MREAHTALFSIGLLILLMAQPVLGAPESARKPSEDRSNVGTPPRSLHLASFYKKYVDAAGLPIVSSGRVPDRALRIAADLASQMLARRPDIRQALLDAHVRVAILARQEVTTDLPEYRTLAPKTYWDHRARGLGATPERPVSSAAEENLLGYTTDPYRGESIFIHEFAHTIHEMALNHIDPQFEPRLQRLYRQAQQRGLWRMTYAGRDFKEYWAEGVQSWFDANLEADPPNGIHNQVNTREELERYDSELAALIAEVFVQTPWRWKPPAEH